MRETPPRSPTSKDKARDMKDKAKHPERNPTRDAEEQAVRLWQAQTLWAGAQELLDRRRSNKLEHTEKPPQPRK